MATLDIAPTISPITVIASIAGMLERSGLRGWPGVDVSEASSGHDQLRLLWIQFNLASQGLLDEHIAQSYILVIRMFAGTSYFEEYWAIAQHEFHDDFAEYVNEQRKAAKT